MNLQVQVEYSPSHSWAVVLGADLLIIMQHPLFHTWFVPGLRNKDWYEAATEETGKIHSIQGAKQIATGFKEVWSMINWQG